MSSTALDEREIGAAFPGPVARLLLRSFLPDDRREEFEGDLIEEAETIVLPRNGRRVALCWFWWQIAASAPSMLARRLNKEVGMYPQRWIGPAALLVIVGLWGLVDLANSPNGGFNWDYSVVIGVRPDGPAGQAGLREGDRILTLDGIPAGDRETLRRQPRTEIGGMRVLVVERTDETTGVTTTENIEITYSRLPTGALTFEIVAVVVGLVFLLSGMLVFLKAPSTPSLLFVIVGFGFAGGMLFPSPDIGSSGLLQAFLSNVLFVAFLTAFASLLHLLLIFPKRKRVMEKRNAGKLIYLPVAAYALLGIIIFTWELPVDRFRTALLVVLGLIFVGYLVLSIVALIHSFVTAAPQ